MNGTWNLYSKEVLGYTAPLTKVNNMYVTTHIVQRFLNEGRNIERIALAWNAGENKKQCSSGINKYGVPYDSCKYIKAIKVAYNSIN